MTKWRHERKTDRREPIEVCQLVLPDADHRYPWEEGFDEALRPVQPALYLPLDPERMLATYAGV